MIEPDGASPWGDVDRYDPKAVKAYMSQLKRMSIRDAAKLQDVPQWYSFVGSPNQTYMQIGNGIPVNLGRAVARRVVEALRASTRSRWPDETRCGERRSPVPTR
jgi:site-specific DNA-cytosine methylase